MNILLGLPTAKRKPIAEIYQEANSGLVVPTANDKTDSEFFNNKYSTSRLAFSMHNIAMNSNNTNGPSIDAKNMNSFIHIRSLQ